MYFRASFLLPLALAGSAFAQNPQDSFQTPAFLISENGTTFQRVWIVSATKTNVRYRETEVSTQIEETRINRFDTIFIQEPPDYAKALDLYQARKYAEAKELFAKVRETYSPVATIENNPSTLAAYHEMECLRKLGDLESLATALRGFDKSPLTRENHLRQIELYLMWEAVRGGNWEQVEKIVEERAKSRLPGDQRAQLAYCHALALEATDRQEEAVAAYHRAMVADSAASEEISRQAALKVLAILAAKPEVKRAIQFWGKPEQNTASPGYNQLLEASSLANLYVISFGGGDPLPEEFQDFPTYRPKKDQEPGLGAEPPETE
ncbi:MAG TPA: hypothetical protein VLO11_04565 [Luteolibacter sp.]|nr:hypothetical protein [Luteolibacter sp.]